MKHGADEIADVEMGADIGRLLPSELCRLVQPNQRLSFFRDLSERQCMQYRLSGAEPLGKGPLVVLLDKSGSMDGDKDVWTTAVALALLDIAQRQRRHFVLLSFESVVRDEVTVLPNDLLPEAALFTGCGGGTEIGEAMKRALTLIEETPAKLKKADVVLITDGWSEPSRRSRSARTGGAAGRHHPRLRHRRRRGIAGALVRSAAGGEEPGARRRHGHDAVRAVAESPFGHRSRHPSQLSPALAAPRKRGGARGNTTLRQLQRWLTSKQARTIAAALLMTIVASLRGSRR